MKMRVKYIFWMPIWLEFSCAVLEARRMSPVGSIIVVESASAAIETNAPQ